MALPAEAGQLSMPSYMSEGGSKQEDASKMNSARSNGMPHGFEDKRVERQKYGLIRYSQEKGVPDIGGLGWRTREGHVLKNQSYFSAFPSTNAWNNPAHAGPSTWKSFHGPRMRTDANLMESLDRLDKDQEDWEVKKLYVNTMRVQTLDRFYNQKVQNEQKEISSSWAPQPRAKREYHCGNDRFEAELDTLPIKELKKVLTPAVLNGDREAVRNITQRLQREETWKATWKEMEVQRRKDLLADVDERMTYNQMLSDLAGQPTRRRDPSRRLPNDCSERLEELAQPRAECHLENVTQHSDYRGLIHVSHHKALEARFPGEGYELAKTFRERANKFAEPGWPPPERIPTPRGSKRQVTGREHRLKQASVPASYNTLRNAAVRVTDVDLMKAGVEQIGKEAPPAPDQTKIPLVDKIVNDAEIMHDTVSLHASLMGSDASFGVSFSKPLGVTKPPSLRPMVYPVLVEVASKTDAARREKSAARLGGCLDDSVVESNSRTIKIEPAMPLTAREPRRTDFPMRDVKIARLAIHVISASGLRGADKSGLSDPFCIARIPGRPKLKWQTKAVKATLNPVWQESGEITEFYAGDRLEFAVYDKDVWGQNCLGTVSLTQDQLLQNGYSGDLALVDKECPDVAATLRVQVEVLENFDPDGRLQAKAVRGTEDSDDEPPFVNEVCCDLGRFEASLKPVPTLGNFWRAPRGDMNGEQAAASQR